MGLMIYLAQVQTRQLNGAVRSGSTWSTIVTQGLVFSLANKVATVQTVQLHKHCWSYTGHICNKSHFCMMLSI
ncbi:hypothetical protein DPMN_008858 [Dreissena polymorpha]|uniref:Uncharacterized protein n=1 Tax=Dreissena polymorpha TaxID=45954 RepID=A0A9D4MVW8_DREPO|nr:hypothetical protein DPMN_008858 [Dreissena polymorpha]